MGVKLQAHQLKERSMSKKDSVSKKDIPEVEEIRETILSVASTGRARSINALEKDVYNALGLSKEQIKYKIKGSKTTLISNRYKDAISQLKKEGSLYSPANGKVKLTDFALSSLKGERSDESQNQKQQSF